MLETPVGEPGGSPAPVMTVTFVATRPGAGKGTSLESLVVFSTVEGEGGGVGGGVGSGVGGAFGSPEGLGGGVGGFGLSVCSRVFPRGR